MPFRASPFESERGHLKMGCVKSLLAHPLFYVRESRYHKIMSRFKPWPEAERLTPGRIIRVSTLAGLCAQAKSIVEVLEGPHSLVNRSRAEILFDSQQLVVLGDSVATCRRSSLDLPGVKGHDQVGNGVILSLA